MPATSRQLLLAAGTPRWAIDRGLRRGELHVVRAGFYAYDTSWRSELEAQLLRGGPDASVSHGAAARLHRLDGFEDHDVATITVPLSSSARRPATRSATLRPDDVVIRDGLRVTTIAKTVLDLGRIVSVDAVEVALESALRGPNPKTPAEWKEDVLAAIVARLAGTRVHGAAALRTVLNRRPRDARPTGSAAETKLVQALRLHGFGDLQRQPTVSVADRRLGFFGEWFPDLFDISSWTAIEVDGAQGHASAEARTRDARRDMILNTYMRVIRVTATDVARTGSDFARGVAVTLADRRRRGVRPPADVAVTESTNSVGLVRSA